MDCPGIIVKNGEKIVGTEAYGTGNMKIALNGALTIGTLDAANVEMLEEVGSDHIFIFGLTAQEVSALQAEGYQPWHYYHAQPELRQVLDMIASGYFSPDEPNRYEAIFHRLTQDGDPFYYWRTSCLTLSARTKLHNCTSINRNGCVVPFQMLQEWGSFLQIEPSQNTPVTFGALNQWLLRANNKTSQRNALPC